jgi:hypothetical protein
MRYGGDSGAPMTTGEEDTIRSVTGIFTACSAWLMRFLG